MTNKEKIMLLNANKPDGCSLEIHYLNLLEQIGGLKRQCYDYMITEPINVDEELKRVETADFDLCGALLTLLLREDHFAQYGCFERRYKKVMFRKSLTE